MLNYTSFCKLCLISETELIIHNNCLFLPEISLLKWKLLLEESRMEGFSKAVLAVRHMGLEQSEPRFHTLQLERGSHAASRSSSGL